MIQSAIFRNVLFSLGAFSCLASFAKGGTEHKKEYFQIGSSSTKLLAVEKLTQDKVEELFGVPEEVPSADEVSGGGIPQINMALVTLDRIINLGKKVWSIVEAGKPVVNIKSDVASAMPTGIEHWAQLEGWQVPKSYLYQVKYKNKLGMDVVTFNYRIMQTYGGTVLGRGKYLAKVAIIPDHVKVAWGYTLNSTASVPNVMNVGSSEAPIGAAELQLDWEIKTTVQYTRDTEVYYLDGEGRFTALSAKNRQY